MNRTLTDGMAKSTKPLLKNLSGSHLLVGLDGGEESLAGWGDASLSNWRFPWSRAFEVRMDIQVNDLTKAAESFLKTLVS